MLWISPGQTRQKLKSYGKRIRQALLSKDLGRAVDLTDAKVQLLGAAEEMASRFPGDGWEQVVEEFDPQPCDGSRSRSGV